MKIRGTAPAIAGRLLTGAAAGISLYLASMALARTALPGCIEHSNCQEVMQSPWAFTFGIPVSFVGFVLYSLTLLWSGAFARRERTMAGLAGSIAVSSVLAGALWFTALQIYAIHSFCVWCVVTHGAAAAGAFLLWCSRMRNPVQNPALVCSADLRGPRSPLSNDYLFRFTSSGATLTGVGLLALGSLSGPSQKRSAEVRTLPALAVAGDTGKGLALLGGRFHLNPDEFPVIGTVSGGGRTAVLLSDYTCTWCLQYHNVLEKLAVSAKPPVRFILLPGAQTPEAEDIQRTVLTVFHADRAAWRSLSALLTSGQIAAVPGEVERVALRLVSPEKFAASAQANADKIHRQIQLAAGVLRESRTGGRTTGMLPQLLCGSRVLSGVENDPEKILAFLDANARAAPRPEPTPLMAVLNADVDLEALEPGKPQDFQIKVQNKGNAPLKLGWLLLDEGCEVTIMPDKKIHPGEMAAIGVRFTPPATAGAFTRRLQIHSDPPGAPGLVTLRGNLSAGVADASAVPVQ